jgi:hypothetical protein
MLDFKRPLPTERPSHWRLLVLLAVSVLAAVMRIWVIRHFPEPDADAKGHFGIAAALLTDPLRVAVHWVWPPGYHYFLALLLAIGVTAGGVRLLNCALAALLPILLWYYGERTLAPSASPAARSAPFLAGMLCAVMPIVNLLGTSAQQETLFTILVLATAWSIDVGRFALAGGLLAVAAMVRYEAWGAIGLLAGMRAMGFVPPLLRRLPEPLARACRLPLVVVVPPLLAVLGWFLAHRVADGTWLGFIREIHRYTHIQRESFHQSLWTEMLWFPVTEPYYLFGLTLPLFFLGVRRAFRLGFVVPLGIYLFLQVSYTFKGMLGSARYYESVTPFVCLSAAYGASVIGERWRKAMPLAFAAAYAHVVWLLVLTGRWTFHL